MRVNTQMFRQCNQILQNNNTVLRQQEENNGQQCTTNQQSYGNEDGVEIL